ncbi:MAG: hypothetical protein JW772_00145 [Candidatus Diapherotrites archaeon]|nr:hypothetical protein [Candidatus Diapherotrites archaeon]
MTKKEQSLAKDDFSINTALQWARWCPVHNGSPPPFDGKGYQCKKCGKFVCAMCFYVTSKGPRCHNCLNDIPETELKSLKAFYSPKAYSKTRKQYLAFGLIPMLFVFFVVMPIILFLGLWNEPAPAAAAIAAMSITILFFAGMFYFYRKIKKEEAKTP